MTTAKFDRIYKDLEERLFDEMKSKKITGSNFYEIMYRMCVSVRTQMVLIDANTLTGNQAYMLMQLPDYVMMKVTDRKNAQ